MRTTYALRNVISSTALGVVVVLIQFLLQWALARTLGPEYLGINSLFLTTIALLAVAELGFGQAIVQQLYRPLKHRQWLRVSVLMRFYRSIYWLVAGSVLLIGVILLPFLHIIVGDNNLDANIYVVFGLFLINAVVSYLISYKRSLIQADQRSYIIDIFYTSTFALVGIAQVVVLFVTHNYYLFLIGNLIFTIVFSVLINRKVSKSYPQVNMGNADKIDPETKSHTLKQVRGLAYHKIASFVIPSSSNVIISILLGLRSVGLASNYILVSNAITMMTWRISGAITASVGNLLVDADIDNLYRVYKKLQFGGAILGTLVATVYILCIDRFIKLWVGEEYALGWVMALVFAVLTYVTVMRVVPNSFKQAAGIFHEDRMTPVMEAIVNIIAGITGALLFGLEGVFLGTVVSTIYLHVYAYPKYVYQRILKKPRLNYAIDVLPFLAITIPISGIAWAGTLLIKTDGWLGLISVGAIGATTVILTFYAIFGRTDEWQFYFDLAKSLVAKMREKSSTS